MKPKKFKPPKTRIYVEQKNNGEKHFSAQVRQNHLWRFMLWMVASFTPAIFVRLDHDVRHSLRYELFWKTLPLNIPFSPDLHESNPHNSQKHVYSHVSVYYARKALDSHLENLKTDFFKKQDDKKQQYNQKTKKIITIKYP